MLNLPKALGLTADHLKAAITAAARWWETMSDAEKRQSRQRALTVGACVAAFAVGGPLLSHRFGEQREREDYILSAASLTEALMDEVRSQPAPGEALLSGYFRNSAHPGALIHPASYTQAAPEMDMFGGLTLRERDNLAIRGLVDFNLDEVTPGFGKDRELNCLAEAVYYEARSEDVAGQLAVAEVVMNRVANPHYPKTVCGVVFQGQYRETGCQFTFTCDGSRSQRPSGQAWDRARDIALNVLLGLNTPVTGTATHYHTDYVNPYWAAGLVETRIIGTHIFYRFPKTGAEWAAARLALAAQNLHAETFAGLDGLGPEGVGLEGVGLEGGLEMPAAGVEMGETDVLDAEALLASSLLVSAADHERLAPGLPAASEETDAAPL